MLRYPVGQPTNWHRGTPTSKAVILHGQDVPVRIRYREASQDVQSVGAGPVQWKHVGSHDRQFPVAGSTYVLAEQMQVVPLIIKGTVHEVQSDPNPPEQVVQIMLHDGHEYTPEVRLMY